MKLSFLNNLFLTEALEIDPTEIEAFIKENNLEDLARVDNGVLRIWRYKIPLNYTKKSYLPTKHLYALTKFFRLIDSMSSQYYEGLFDIEPEESEAIKNLIMKVIMPHDQARDLALTLNKKPEKALKTTYLAYKKIDSDVDILQLPKNLALLLSTMIDYRKNNRRNYRYYDEEDQYYNPERNETERDRMTKEKLEYLKQLNSHSKRLEMFRTAAWLIQKDYSRYGEPDISPQQFSNIYDKSAMKIFTRLEDVEKAGWGPAASLSRAFKSVEQLKDIKSVRHMPTIPAIFWQGVPELKTDLRYRAPNSEQLYPKIIEWWAQNPGADRTIIVDTLSMAHRYNQPVRFLNRDLAALEAEHAELVELSQAEEKKQVFDNDILPIKELDELRLEYLNNTYDLKYEGKVMNHCVGSYADSCAQGTSIVYRAYWNDKHIGTLELSDNGNDYYDGGKVTLENAKIRQLYGRHNKRLSDKINAAAKKLLELNRQKVKEDKDDEARLALAASPREETPQTSVLRQAAREREEEEANEPRPEFEENCFECGSPRTEMMRGGSYCHDCGNFEQDPEYRQRDEEDWY